MDNPVFWKKIKRLEKIKINFSKQYRSELGHALASFALLSSGFINHCSLCFAKQIPSEVGLSTGGAILMNSTSLSVLTSSFALLAFSKY